MNATYEIVENPISMVLRVLTRIMNESSKPGTRKTKPMVITKVVEAPEHLKSSVGIDLLVTMEDPHTGKKALVPFDVDDDDTKVIHTQFYTREDRTSWRGMRIQKINRRFCLDPEQIYHKVLSCLKTAWHRLMRKIDSASRRAQGRSYRRDETHIRHERARMCWH